MKNSYKKKTLTEKHKRTARVIYITLVFFLMTSKLVQAYIDPGTGSMLFTILIGVLGAAFYKFKDLTVKARFMLSGGKATDRSIDSPDYVIFSDHKRYWNVFEPICDEFERRKTKIIYMTASADDPALDKPYQYVECRFIGEGNKAYATLNTLHADIVLSTTPSLDVFYWKRSKHVKYYFHAAHAASDLTMYRMFGIDFYDAILISGDYQEKQLRELEKIRHLPEKELVMVGLPFLDAMKARLESAGKVHNERTKVLLAPSWRPSAIFSRFGGQIIEALKVMPKVFSEAGYAVTVLDPTYAGYKWVPDISIYDDMPNVKKCITMGKFTLDELQYGTSDESSKQIRMRNFFLYSIFKTTPQLFQPTIYANGSYNSAEGENKKWQQIILSDTKTNGMNETFLRSYAVLCHLSDITSIKKMAKRVF